MVKLLKHISLFLISVLVMGVLWWFIADYTTYEDRPQKPIGEYIDLESDFQRLFQLAQDGDTIHLPAGHYKFKKALILDGRNNVTIKGAGMDKTVLSFREQAEGAEGIRVANGHSISVEGFTIQDAIGDNIKAIYVDTLTFRDIKTEWTGIPNTSLGAYGLYPVMCKNILIEACEANRGSDSGLYVGQSENVVIRNNKAYENVSGINVENSGNVDIYNNECYHNTTGLVVLDIPGLTRNCTNVKVHHNKIYSNDLYNFAPDGNVAASNLPSTGILLWAAKETHIHDNKVTDQAFPILISSFLTSYEMTKDKEYVPIAASELARMEVSIEEETSLREDAINKEFEKDKTYRPYTENVVISNNEYSFGSFRKKVQCKDGFLFTLGMKLKNAHVWFDGVNNPNGSTICLQDKSDVIIANMDFANDFENAGLHTGQDYKCASDVLSSTF